MTENAWPCIEYAKENGPIDGDEIAWCLCLAMHFKANGFPEDRAAAHLARLAMNGDNDEIMDIEEIAQQCHFAYGRGGALKCQDVIGCDSFSRGCTREDCPEYDQSSVHSKDAPGIKSITYYDEPGAIGVDVRDGRVKTVKLKKKDEDSTTLEWISDIAIYVHTETVAGKEREFTFHGVGANDGTKAKFCMPAEDLADPRKFRAALINYFGVLNRVGKMTFETVQAITQNPIKRRRLHAPTWVDGKPEMPGFTSSDDIEFRLLDMIPAMVGDGDLEEVRDIITHMMKIPGPVPIILTTVLGSPLYARWFFDDRFGAAIWGRSGSLKTSMAKKIMCVWGSKYKYDAFLLKHGKAGSTAVGAAEVLAGAGFLPVILDNVKAVEGRDSTQYILLVHSVIEGKDKIRGKKDGGIRESKDFFTTPIITGEIKPEEASTSARILNLIWQEPVDKTEVDYVDARLDKMPAIGYKWLQYLSTIEDPREGFNDIRTKKTDEFNKKGYTNSGRLATIYTLLKLTWKIMLSSPLGEALKPYDKKFHSDLNKACEEQGAMVSDETEVSKFMAGIRAMLAAQPHLFQLDEDQHPGEQGRSMSNEVIGRWIDGDLFLVPENALKALKRLEVFTQIPTKGSIGTALSQAGLLIEKPGKHTLQQRMNGHRIRGWMLKGSKVKQDHEEKKLTGNGFQL